jgi:hypothetical protein
MAPLDVRLTSDWPKPLRTWAISIPSTDGSCEPKYKRTDTVSGQTEALPSLSPGGLELKGAAKELRPGHDLPRDREPFGGSAGRTLGDCTPSYPQPTMAPDGAPNVLLIMLDDIGFGQAGVSGGPVPTPNMDALAGRDLTFGRFHTTFLCSPPRAALLTGRNHHRVGFGTIDLVDGDCWLTTSLPLWPIPVLPQPPPTTPSESLEE